MFGSDNQNQNPDGQTVESATGQSSASPADMPTEDIAAEPNVVSSAPSAPTIPDPMVTPSAQPIAGINGVPAQTYPDAVPQIGTAKPSEPGNIPSTPSIVNTGPGAAVINPDLAQIKLQALQNLEPLVDQLDQTPDEKFKTVMMLIQASDNSKLLKEAYAAASQITDEKVRAQALLDVVSEINYFTQQAANK